MRVKKVNFRLSEYHRQRSVDNTDKKGRSKYLGTTSELGSWIRRKRNNAVSKREML